MIPELRAQGNDSPSFPDNQAGDTRTAYPIERETAIRVFGPETCVRGQCVVPRPATPNKKGCPRNYVFRDTRAEWAWPE